MSQRANYFKLGLFVIGALVAGILVLVLIGSGRFLERRVTVETYFKESVQGLDIGSKLKYRGVTIGEVTKITFTYTRYQQDLPINQRERYVLVEAQLQPRLLGGRAAAGDMTNRENAKMEVEKGLRIRIAPQGITGLNFLEMDYVDPPPPVLPIDWEPDNLYIPSAPGTVTALVNAAQDIMEKLHRIDLEATVARIDKLLDTTNERIAAVDVKALQERAEKTLAKLDTTLDGLQAKKVSDEATALLSELRQTNAELRKTLANPAWQKIPDDTAAAVARVKDLVSDPKLARTVASLERIVGRFDRLFGATDTDLATTLENLRTITDNLRDLTEETKRYPASVIFGQPPAPLERKK
ncbi:MAG: MCE family protein [Burkholderiales bacterium]|nr:MCE family protein [Burkholderiales bacterium]